MEALIIFMIIRLLRPILASAREKLKDSTKKSAILESCSIVKELTTGKISKTSEWTDDVGCLKLDRI